MPYCVFFQFVKRRHNSSPNCGAGFITPLATRGTSYSTELSCSYVRPSELAPIWRDGTHFLCVLDDAQFIAFKSFSFSNTDLIVSLFTVLLKVNYSNLILVLYQIIMFMFNIIHITTFEFEINLLWIELEIFFSKLNCPFSLFLQWLLFWLAV